MANINDGNTSRALSGTSSADVINGNGGNDTIQGYGGRDTIYGGNDQDSIYGGDDNDYLSGDSGNDSLWGDSGDDVLYGGAGNDRLFGGAGDDLLHGGAGSDYLDGGDGNDTVSYAGANGAVSVTLGGSGWGSDAGNDSIRNVENVIGSSFNDTLTGTSAAEGFFGGAGRDSIYGGLGDDTIAGGAGADYLSGDAGLDFADYRASNAGVYIDLDSGSAQYGGQSTLSDAYGDTLIGMDGFLGSQYDDTVFGFDGWSNNPNNTYTNIFYGGGGNDYMHGRAGNDELFGDDGNDTLIGGADQDLLDGGTGDDFLNAGSGNDTLYGGDGNDSLWGSTGNDSLFGGSGNDTMDGGSDHDLMEGGAGEDVMVGGSGADSLFGGAGNDTLDGGADNDRLDGGEGDDSINGGSGADTLFGGAGADILDGGQGKDYLYGGVGHDTLYGSSGDHLWGGDGNDLFVIDPNAAELITIHDFGSGNSGGVFDNDASNNDYVDLAAFYNDQTLAIWNSQNPDNQFANPMAWARFDYEDNGIFDAVGGGGLQIFGSGGVLLPFSELNLETTGVVCFTRGTLISTLRGEIAIEDLRAGDMIRVMDGVAKPLRWVGSRRLGAAQLALNPKMRPYRIRAGALGINLPLKDTVLSPQHRIFLNAHLLETMAGMSEALMPIKHLSSIEGIDLVEDIESVEYFHLLFDRHEIIFANGAPMESLQMGIEARKMLTAHSLAEILQIMPHLPVEGLAPARPIIQGKTARKIAARLAKKGYNGLESGLAQPQASAG